VARTVCHLSNLNRLSLTKNKLRAFPNHMHHLLSLRFLYLDDNALEEGNIKKNRIYLL
jgi:Leucine-rich repeat (LRR) protein